MPESPTTQLEGWSMRHVNPAQPLRNGELETDFNHTSSVTFGESPRSLNSGWINAEEQPIALLKFTRALIGETYTHRQSSC